jgi:hypothetical protein
MAGFRGRGGAQGHFLEAERSYPEVNLLSGGG